MLEGGNERLPRAEKVGVAKKSKSKSVFVCAECGASTPRWMGKCPTCGVWDSLKEMRVSASPSAGGGAAKPRAAGAGAGSVPVAVKEVEADQVRRTSTGSSELDRVLGGGLVPGGVVLLGGDPGVGKSTLMMQALAGITARGGKGLYVTGEESAAQVALRAERIGGRGMDEVLVLATTELSEVEAALDASSPTAVVLDSVQTVREESMDSVAGSVSQIREVASRLIEVSKRRGMALFLIGHVTKEGTLAGPKVLEHLVDTVLYFEGDSGNAFRIVRAHKNRFGAAHELGVFEMHSEGLKEVPDPSAHFLSERQDRAPGSVVVPTTQGSRPLLVEVQALVAPAVYGAARRVASGIDGSRLAILLAVLERKAEVRVLDRDVFVSLAGGARVEERALDLGVAAAIVSSLRDRPVASKLLLFGEVGLAGELRAVPRPGARLREARKLGFEQVVIPRGNLERLTPEDREGLRVHAAKDLSEALRAAFDEL